MNNKLSKEEFKELFMAHLKTKQQEEEILKTREYRAYAYKRRINKDKIYKSWYSSKYREGLTSRDIRISTRLKLSNIHRENI